MRRYGFLESACFSLKYVREKTQGSSLHCKNGSGLENDRSCRTLDPYACIRLDLIVIRRRYERCLRNQDDNQEEFIRDRGKTNWRHFLSSAAKNAEYGIKED